MTILTVAEVYNYADKVEEVFRTRICGIAQEIDLVKTDVNCLRKAEMFVYFFPAEVSQVEVKPFQMKDQIVRRRLEACPDAM